MTLAITDKIWAAFEKVGATGATPVQLAELSKVHVSDVRFFLKSRISRERSVIARLHPGGSRNQAYVLQKYAPTALVEAPKSPPAKRSRPKAPPKPKPAPKPKAAPPAAPTGPREPPICGGTAPRITAGEAGLIPRMVCARADVLDQEEKPIPSLVGGKHVPHRAPVAMCSSPK